VIVYASCDPSGDQYGWIPKVITRVKPEPSVVKV